MSSKKARTWVPTVTTAVAVAALSVPLAAGVANASPVTADVPAACATAPVSDRAKPVVAFACDMASKKANAKDLPGNSPYSIRFIAAAWKEAGVTFENTGSEVRFYSSFKGDRKPGDKAIPGDVVFKQYGDSRYLSLGVYVGDGKVAEVFGNGEIKIGPMAYVYQARTPE
ncbi:hypothetical protein ACFQ78_15380 [Streptomyces sp. NPDC056519]